MKRKKISNSYKNYEDNGVKGVKILVNYADFHTNKMLKIRQVYMKDQVDNLKLNRMLHFHEGFEIYFFHKGNAKYIVNGNVFNLCPGDMLLFNGTALHRPNPDKKGPYIRSFINFMPEWIQHDFSNQDFKKILALFHVEKATKIQWSCMEAERIKEQFASIQRELNQDKFGSDTMIRALLVKLIIDIMRKLDVDKASDNQGALNLKERYVQSVLAVINERYNDDLSLDHIAESLHLNKYHMCHCFKEVTGLTINYYIATKRIEEAKRRLAHTKGLVHQIAFEVGFNNPVHFSRLFKKHAGLSPNQYRKQFLDLKVSLSQEHKSNLKIN